MKKLFFATLITLSLTACGEVPTKRVFDRDLSLGDLPFSSAVVVGNVIYLSGEIGRAPGSLTLVEGGVEAQTRQIFENYQVTLARLGSDLSDVVKCTIFLDDFGNYSQMNKAYVLAFPGDKPARSTLGVDGLAFGADLEIECLAITNNPTHK